MLISIKIYYKLQLLDYFKSLDHIMFKFLFLYYIHRLFMITQINFQYLLRIIIPILLKTPYNCSD